MKTRDGKCGEKEEGWKVHTVFQNPSSDGRGRRCISVSLKSATLFFSTAAVLWALTCSRHSAAGLTETFFCVCCTIGEHERARLILRQAEKAKHTRPPPAHLFLGKQKKTSTKTKSSDDNKLVEKLTSDWTIPGWLWVVSQNNWAVLF